MVAVLVPTLALSVLGGRVVADRRADVSRAEAMSAQLAVVDQLIDLRAALFAERVAAEIMVPDRRPPDDVLATTEFGRTVLAGTASLERATDDALARLAPHDRPFELDELAAVRADRAEWSVSSDTIRARLEPLSTRTLDLLTVYGGEVRANAVRLGNSELIAAGTSFQRSIYLPDRAGEVCGALSDLWAAPPPERPQRQSQVARAAAVFDTTSGIFAASLTDAAGPVAEYWSGAMQMPPAVADVLRQAETGQLSSPERPAGEPPSVGIALLQAVDWTIRADNLPMIAADHMSDLAAGVADDARSTERMTVGLIVLAISLSVAVGVLFGRSIVAPVRRLTDHAKGVGGGDLTLGPLPLGGPPDVASASAAMNDVVTTLRLLEHKSHALADIDLAHPSLREPLPGGLGASLQRSTEVLSNSIVEREHLRAQLLHDATHDSLTGLANRAALLDALREVRERGASMAGTAVVFIDLDGFKQINDRQGHGAGDVVLQVTAARIAEIAPPRSTVARLGGDEFVVLLTDTANAKAAVALARAMVDAVAAPIDVHGQRLSVRACAGVAVGDEAGTALPGPSDLLRRADLAVYDAKQAAPGTVACYDEVFGQRVAGETDIEMALSAALQPGADELRLVYQPIVATPTRSLASLETLVRWDRRGHGRVLPDDFVPIAERSGLIVNLDLWVLRMVARQLAAWANMPELADVPVSVNVSGRTLLQSGFVTDVSDALNEHGVDASRLTIEVTETALVTDLGLAAVQLERIRALGVRISIDDFGTGYTSIGHLRVLPVDELKIDSSFIRRLPDPGDRVLIQMIKDLATLLGLSTVAEGVENGMQTDILAEIGCDALQGYYFAEPLDAGAIARWAGGPVGAAAAIDEAGPR